MRFQASTAKAVWAALILSAAAALGACHSAEPHRLINPQGNVVPPGPSAPVEETVPASGVGTVVLDGVGQLFVQPGGSGTLRIQTQEHILPYIRTEMQGDRLVVGFEPGTSYQGEASWIQFHLTGANPERIELRGTGGITASDLNPGHMSLVHAGIGSIDLSNLTAQRIQTNRSGTGQITVSGDVQQQSVALGGMGQYDTRHLNSAVTDVRILGLGSATVRVSQRLEARIDGSGSVYYFGSPVVERTGLGSGSVQRIGD